MLTKAEYSPIIKQEWSDDFYEELRPQLGIVELISNDYEGEISDWGDTVKVQTIGTPGRAQILESDNEAYNAQVPTFSNTDLVVDKCAVFPVDITDWARYQANPKYQDQIRTMAVHEVARGVDQRILDTMAPDTILGGQANMTKALFARAARELETNDVPMDGNWIALIDPLYKEDLIQVNEILSRDFSPTSSVFMSGKLKDPIYGFQTHVSNLLPANTAFFFHKSFMNIAIQLGADYKEMDLEASTNVPAHRVRVKTLFGLKQFDAKRIFKITA